MSTTAQTARPANGQAPQPPKETPYQTVERLLSAGSTTIEEVLPDYMKGQGNRLTKRALITMSKNAMIQDCSAQSFYQCVLQAAELGLAIDGKLAHAVPFNNKKKDAQGREYWVKEVQFQIDYKGMVAVARRSKVIKDAYAQLVYRGDHFQHGIKNGECYLEHSYKPDAERRDLLGAFAIVKFPDGDWRYEWMSTADLDRIKGRSKAASKGFSPWQSDEGEMYRKTVIKRLLKLFLDMDSHLLTAFQHDDDVIDVEAPPSVEVPPNGRQRFHTNRLTAEMPAQADFQGPSYEQEPVPARTGGDDERKEVGNAPAPAPDHPPRQEQSAAAQPSEDDELRKQELVDYVKDQLDQDLTPKALEEVGALILRSASLLGDAVPYLSGLYERKKNPAPAAAAAGGKRRF